MEPLSILSVIFQLATVTPEINKVFIKEKNSNLTRTEIIEFYRSNMNSKFQEKRNDWIHNLTINKLIIKVVVVLDS